MDVDASLRSALSRYIKEKALALGFDSVGMVPAQPFKNGEPEALSAWLQQGFQAEMEWMRTHFDKRKDPASLMEGVQSIVCVALNYYNPDGYDPSDPQALKIAKYARGTDYHDVIKGKLKKLLKDIQQQHPAIQGRALTDSAPIMEKPLAIQAGLGWMGKNGNVILPSKGSFFFLGELLLNVPLDYDVAFGTNHCGNCRRCIEACPTHAIVSEGTIDANRCISYWTIEYKGERFPETIQENLNSWIFGCDICQDVCPWNIRFAKPTQEPLFEARPWNKTPQADTILALNEETFRVQYQKSPIKRSKIHGFKRNVRMATKPDFPEKHSH